MSQRPIFTSRLATILTMIGVAVGLGNVWRFPYMMGKYGGSAFLFVYLIFSFLFAIPALMGEMALGREGRQGVMGTFKLALGTQAGKFIGYILLATILIASSYYAVVIANVVFSAGFSIMQGFEAESFPMYAAQLGNGWLQYGICLGVLLLSCGILDRGLHKGIEAISKLFVPVFLIIILYLIFYVLSIKGANEQLLQFLRPDFSALTAQNIFAALGQAFYSLSLGGTFMLMYGSYLNQQASIPRLAIFTSAGDIGAALLSSLFIVPAVLVFQLDMSSGPTLIFSTLPHLFEQLPAGKLVGSLFLAALSFVAILSLIAALEVAVGSIMDIGKQKWSRRKIIIAIGILEVVLSLPSSIYPDLIGILDLVFGSGMQLLGCGLALFALSWGLGKSSTLFQVFGKVQKSWHQFYFIWIRWVVPFILLVVLIGYIYSSFF